MAIRFERRSVSAGVLLVALVAAIGIFGAPARYGSALAIALSAAQLLVIGGAAGSLIVPAWRSRDEERRRIAVTGLVLLMPWALLTLMPGYGPPFASNLPMNHVRFVILFVSTLFVGGGFLLLKDPLSDGGDRLAAPLGQAAGLLATLIQLVWASILVGWTMTEAHRSATYLPMDGTPLANASDVLLFFAGLMTYVATAFYAVSFARQGWLGPVKATIMVVIAAVAVVGLVARGLQYPDLSERWYTTPGMIVGIPAIPWLMPYMLGVCALVRAAGDRIRSA
jgi:hypothetical protein